MKRIHSYFVILAVALYSCCTGSEDAHNSVKVVEPGEAVSVGMSADRLERIDSMMQSGVDEGAVKGVSGIIIRKGKIVYEKAFGDADAHGKKLQTDDIFRIASQTKAITSVAVMMLFEEGKFLLDDRISSYLPEFKNMEVLDEFNSEDSSYTSHPAAGSITIRQLLTHTSGMTYFGFGDGRLRSIYAKNGMISAFGTDQENLAHFSEIAGQMPLLHEPGKRFSYGINTDILGRLVEVVSGMSLDEFFKTRIFEPLGMEDTYFYVPKSKADRLVSVMVREGGKLVEFHGLDEFGIPLDYPLLNGTFFSGGAGLSSTLKDYAIFLQMMLNKGEYNGHQLLSPRTVEMMTSNQIGDLKVDADKFGLGFRVKTFEGSQQIGESEGSFSWGGYYGSIYWADPKEQIVGVFFVNQRSGMPGNIPDKFKLMTYAALKN